MGDKSPKEKAKKDKQHDVQRQQAQQQRKANADKQHRSDGNATASGDRNGAAGHQKAS